MGDKNPNKPPKKKKISANEPSTISAATDSVGKSSGKNK